MVAEVVPLKQGLKLEILAYGSIFIDLVAEVVPLKQGLKPALNTAYGISKSTVAEVVPLKQGLKHIKVRGFKPSQLWLQR